MRGRNQERRGGERKEKGRESRGRKMIPGF